MGGSKKEAESPHLSSMAKVDFSGVQFSEVFWALPEYDFPAGGSGSQIEAAVSSQAANAWPQIVGLDAVVCDTSSEPAERPSGIREHIYEQVAKSDKTADVLNVASSQVEALRDLVLNMQQQLREANDKHSAMNEQLNHTSACLQHLQHAEQAWELEQKVWATRINAGSSRENEAQGSHAAQTRMVEAALQLALLHEGQLMAEVISLQHMIASVPETESGNPGLSDRAGGNKTPDVSHSVAEAPLTAGDNESALPEELKISHQSTRVSTVASSLATAKPEQLRHAHSVIAELSVKLAELECCNALLQDELAISAGDLIKSGPQHMWLADSFPWDARVVAENGDDLPQDSALVKAAIDSIQDAESIAPDEEGPADGSLQDEGLTGGYSSTHSAGDAAVSNNAAGNKTGTQEWSTASEQHAPSTPAPAGPGQMADTWPTAQPKATRTLTESAGSGTTRVSSSRLSAAEEQNARLAATHAELERCLLHAQNQLRDFAGAASAQMPAPTAHSFQAAQEALTQAVAEVRSTGPQNAPEMLSGRTPAESLRLNAFSQGPYGHLNGVQDSGSAADLGPELAASKARLARTAEQLAESERCREHLEQQLLDVGEARHNAHLRGLRRSTDLRAEVADSTARLALLAQQLAESERCKGSLQQQLLELGEARLTAGSSGDQPTKQAATRRPPSENLYSGQAVNSSAEASARRDIALLESSASEGSQAAAEREPGTALEAATSEVAALRVAMTQSESIFLDLEAQLRAAFKREAASHLRIAALEQELGQAGMHARRASAAQSAVAGHDRSAMVPFVQHQTSASDITKMQPQSLEAGAIVVHGSVSSPMAPQKDMPADGPAEQMQVLTAQLRAALHQVSNAETVINRLHDQLFNQHALITELRLALSASGQSSDIPDAGLGAAPFKAEAGGKALQLEYPDSNSLLTMAIVEEILSDSATQPDTAGEMQLIAEAQKALQVRTPSAASNSGLQTTAKPPLRGSAHISHLAVTCALIAGQTEFPEELYSLVMSEDSAPSAYSRDVRTGRVSARSEGTRQSQRDAVPEHTESAHSTSQRMRENPLFLQGRHQGHRERDLAWPCPVCTTAIQVMPNHALVTFKGPCPSVSHTSTV